MKKGKPVIQRHVLKGIQMAINKVKQWKATGIEGIPNEISKSFILFHI